MQLCLLNTEIYDTEPGSSAEVQLSQLVSFFPLNLNKGICNFKWSFTV